MLCATCSQGYFLVGAKCQDCDGSHEIIASVGAMIVGISITIPVAKRVVSRHFELFAEMTEFLWASFSIQVKIIWSTSQSA